MIAERRVVQSIVGNTRDVLHTLYATATATGNPGAASFPRGLWCEK